MGRHHPRKFCERRFFAGPLRGLDANSCASFRAMPPRVLCVAEKPSIAKDLAAMLSGGQVSSLRASRRHRVHLQDRAPAALQRRPPCLCTSDRTAHGSLWQAHGQQTAARYISKFEFPHTLHGQQCQFVMMAVVGHLHSMEFGDRYRHALSHAAAMFALLRFPAQCSISES